MQDAGFDLIERKEKEGDICMEIKKENNENSNPRIIAAQ